MVRALVIRQVFIVLDFALAALIVITASLVGMQLVEPAPRADASVFEGSSDESADGGAFQLPEVAKRKAYNGLVKSGLFGEAGRFDPTEEPPPPPPEPKEEEAEDTQFNLRLVGTTAVGPESRFSSAFIEDLDQRTGVQTYKVDGEVLEKVKLAEVYQREVILLNERNTPATRERLRMDEEGEGESERVQVARRRTRPLPKPDSSRSERITLDRQEFIKDLYTNYADLVTKVKPELYKDANGKVVGITAKNISQVPLARKLGFVDGDVLQSVNNERIDSEQKILEMVQKYRNASSFRVGVMRNGKPKVITYRLN